MFLFKRGKFYHLEYYDEYENRKKRISTKCINKKDALRFLTNFKTAIHKSNKVKFISLKSFQQEYLEYIKSNFSKSYYVTVEVSFRLLINEIGDVPLNKISYPQLDKFFTVTFNRTKEGARTYLIALKSAFNKAVKWGYINDNIFTQIRLPKIPKHLPVTINHTELMNIIQNTSNRDLQDIFLTGFHTGMRLSEIINLKWLNVKLDERRIIIRNTENFTTKNKNERVIPINDTLFRVLSNRTKNLLNIYSDSYVFSKCDGVPYLKDYVSKNFKKVIRNLEMNEKIHFHSLRHSAASNMVQAGVSLYVVKEILGHEDLVTTQIYSHLKEENLLNGVKVLDEVAL
jgi:site-specific recombinase XerD